MTSEQLEDLRDFLEELDVIPLSALPPEVWPIVYEHQQKLANNEIPFDDFYEAPFYQRLHERLKLRKSQRKQHSDEQFKLQL